VLRRPAVFWVRFSCHNSVSFHRIDLWVADSASLPLPPRATPPFAECCAEPLQRPVPSTNNDIHRYYGTSEDPMDEGLVLENT
jgi:hypothetical protein